MAALVTGHYEKVLALASNGRLLCIGGVRPGGETRVTVFDLAAAKAVGSMVVSAHVYGLAFAGDRVVAACSDGALRAWHLSAEGAATDLGLIAAHEGVVYAVAVAPDGDRVASVGADGRARLWSLTSKSSLAEHALSSAPLRAVAIDPSGEYLGAAGDDGVVRVVTLATGARREMPGHDGAVHALAFTPRDGRLASAGDDGTLRIWYLVGSVECESRDDAGSKGALVALVFPPTPAPAADGSDPGDRVYAATTEGKVKVWRLDDRRKPRTLDVGSVALRALCFAHAAGHRKNLGELLVAGDARSVHRYAVDLTGTPAETGLSMATGFNVAADDLRGQRPAREAAVKLLAAMEEPEAIEMLLGVMTADREVPVRVLAVSEAARNGRRGVRGKLRELLNDVQKDVRAAAFAGLRSLDVDAPLTPLRAALASAHPDLRIAALRALVAQRDTSPLVPGLIAERLTDADAAVRVAALDELTKLHPAGSPDPLRAAWERGPADLKAEAMVRAAFGGLVSHPTLAPVLSRALDDADATVRRYAFTVKVLERTKLLAALEKHDDALGRTVTEIVRRGASLRRQPGATGALTDVELQAARAAIPAVTSDGATLDDDDLAPLHTAMACHTPDTALRGARALAQLGDTRALGALLQLSREADASLRKEAALALQALDDARARKRIVWMLNDGDASVRGAALDAYGRFKGTAPLDVAEAALRSSHEDIRVRGLDQIVKLGAREDTETLLGDAVEDETAKVRGEAFNTLWAWHVKEPAKALDRALTARFPDLRLRAVRELATLAKDSWAFERLRGAIVDRDGSVGLAAYEAVVKLAGEKDAAAHLAAMTSLVANVRTVGAKGAAHAALDAVRSALTKLLSDDEATVRVAALETLDRLDARDAGAHHAALQGSHLDLRVRAAELLAVRHDEALVDPMRALIADKDLPHKLTPPVATALRHRAASALATLGASKLVRYFATELLKDDDAYMREQAARGLATAARHGDEGHLLDALGHGDVWVRSWAADGLSRLGDARALPVLTGNLRNDHLPIRLGAILSFAALGPEGYGAMLQGLEDGAREVQEMVFAIILARDLRAFRRGEAPDLLASALSSLRPEVRFAAARALELRTDPSAYLAYLLEVLSPARPEAKSAAARDWPPEETRGRILVGLAEALASDRPAQRYAAAQALHLRKKPAEFFREAQRAARPTSVHAPWVPDTTPRGESESDVKPAEGWLRRLFAGDAEETPEAQRATRDAVPGSEQQTLRRLAFGAYVGMLRQNTSDEEGHRTRRDAIERIVELGRSADVGVSSAVPALARALDDGHHLVRKAAFAGLKRLYGDDVSDALSLALASQSSDVARGALDELAAAGADPGSDAWKRIAKALNSPVADVRRYAFELLERLSPRGSLDPLLAALSSEHADLRVGVIERLATSNDDRVVAALGKALESDHDDLRLRAAELLSARRDDRAVDVLAGFLRGDDKAAAARAVEALVRIASPAAVGSLATRSDELLGAERAALVRALGRSHAKEAVAFLVLRFDDDDAGVRAAALDGCWEVAGRDRKKRDHALALGFLRAAVRAKDAALRLGAANELDAGEDAAADELLVGLFGDRDVTVRQAAVFRYARRVIERGAAVAPLDAVLRAGQRELVLPAAEGVAAKGLPSALRPLLLVVRAGESGERERALLALGTLGDARALDELETVAGGGTKEEPVDASMQSAAVEALGRLAPKLTDLEARGRVVERVELAAAEQPNVVIRQAALRGLRWMSGERARVKLEAALTDASAFSMARVTAAEELGALGDHAAESTLGRTLDDHDLTVRTAARKALDALFPKEPTRVALLAVDAIHADIAMAAAMWLATEGDPTVLVPRLGALPNPALRARLRYGLLRRGAAPVDALGALLEHPKASAREEAAWLAGAYTGGDGSAPNHTALDATSRATLQSALASALRRAPQAWSSAHPKERDAEATAWARVLWAAARHHAPVGDAARALLGDVTAPVAVRREAVRALASLGGGADVAALVAALGDADGEVRASAARALEALAPDEAAMKAATVRPFDAVGFGVTARRPVARAALLATDEGRRLALPAVIVGHETAPLVALASNASADAAARADAIAALGRTGGDDAVRVLTTLAFDKKAGDAGFRKAAYRALKRARRVNERTRKMEAER